MGSESREAKKRLASREAERRRLPLFLVKLAFLHCQNERLETEKEKRRNEENRLRKIHDGIHERISVAQVKERLRN